VAAHRYVDLRQCFLLAQADLGVGIRHHRRHSESAASRDDCCFVQLVGAWSEVASHCMASFMDRGVKPFFFRHRKLLALNPHHDAVASILKVDHFSFLFAEMDCLCNRCINQVFNLCAREPGSHRRKLHRLNRLIVGDIMQVQVEYVSATIHVGKRNMNLLIKAARSDGGRVKRVLVVGGSNNHNIHVLLKPVHLGEELVDRCATAAVLVSEAARHVQKRINFIDKHNARLVLLGELEHFANPLGSHADKHLVESRTRTVDEGNTCLLCNCTAQQSLARARSAAEQNSFVQLGSLGSVFLRKFNHLDYILNLFFNLVYSFDIV